MLVTQYPSIEITHHLSNDFVKLRFPWFISQIHSLYVRFEQIWKYQ